MKRADWALLAATVLVGASWCHDQLRAFDAHAPQWGHDVAFFNQIFWSGANGGEWTSPILLEPTGFFDMVHFHPVFLALMPVYWMVQSAKTLLVFNVLAVVLTAWPLARLAKAASGHAGFGALAGIAWLISVPVESAALADFRPMVFFVPGFALVLLGAWRGRWAPLIAGALLVCFAREESGYLLGFAGAVLVARPLGEGRRVHGAVLLGIGVTWFLVLLAIKGNLFFHFNPATYAAGASQSVPAELVQARSSFGLSLLFSGYGLALLSPVALLLAAPSTGFLVLDTWREWHMMTGPYVHLRSASLILVAGAGTLGGAWLARRRPWLVGLAMVVGNYTAFHSERERLRHRMAGIDEILASPEWQAREQLLSHVPTDAAVGTDYGLIANLSGREVLWNTVHLYLQDQQPPHWEEPWPITADDLDVLVVTPEDPVHPHLGPEWEVLRAGGGYQLLQQRKPSSP